MPTALIADDMAIVHTILGRIVSAAGFTVVEATDAKSASETFGVRAPDVVLLDLNLGAADGLDVLRPLRTADQAARIIVVSAERAAVKVRDVLEAGAVDFVAKPCTKERVTAALKRTVPGPSSVD